MKSNLDQNQNMKDISISVVTVTLNCVESLPNCLASVAEQKGVQVEHIIIDGASTDGTKELINKHIDQIDISKSEGDDGIYDALNKGIRLASGDIVGFLHADDIYASNDALYKIKKSFEDPSVSAVFGDLEYVRTKDKSKVIRAWKSKPYSNGLLSWGWMPPHPTLYVRREWYLKFGGFDKSYSIAGDYHSILVLFSQPGFKTIYIPNVLVKMSLGGASNKSLIALQRKFREDWRALRSCDFSILRSLFAIISKNLCKIKQFL